MMATSLSELLDFTENIYTWAKGNDGHFSAIKFAASNGVPRIIRTFSPLELAKIHADLPLCLNELLRWHYETHFTTTVLGHRVDSLLSLILDDVVHCTDIYGYDRVLKHVYGYMVDSDNADNVVIEAMLLSIEKRNVDGVEIAFVTGADTVDVKVPIVDLNKRYPGWADRWLVANTLEIRRDELRRYVFPSQQVLTNAPANLNIEFN